MKVKTSITLSDDVLAAVDKLAGSERSRSAVIERAVRAYVRRQARATERARELARLNRAAERLNVDAADTLAYQAPLPEDPDD